MSFNSDGSVSVGRRVVKNSLANYVAKACDAVSNLVAIGLLSRYLGIDDFGKYSFIVALTAIFRATSGMGVPAIAVREIAKGKENVEKIYASSFLLHIFFALITISIMTICINLINPYEGIKIAAILCTVAIVLELFSKLFSAIFQAYERMEYDAYQTIFAQSLYVISTICVVKFDFGFTGVFVALIFTFASECTFGFCVVSKKFVRLRLKGNCDRWKYLLKESYSIGIKNILRKLNYRIDTLVLAAMKSKAEVALFHGVYMMVRSLIFLAEGATMSIFPLFARYSATSKESFQKGYEKSFKFLILIGLPFGIFFSYFSKPIITLILGKAFVDATPVLQIFGWVLALMFLSNLMQKMLIIGGKQAYIMWVIIISLCINFGFDILLIPKMSITGAGIATLLSEIALFGLTFYLVFKHVSHVQITKVALKPIFAAIITCAVLFYIYQVNIYVAVCSGILVYATVLFLIKTFTQDEMSIFKQIISRKKPILD